MPTVGSIMTNKIIETEFYFGTYILKNRIDINDPLLYKELIDTNFQHLILTIASLYEVLVKLCETLLKKIVIYDGIKSPYLSIHLKLFILNWDKLVDLGYRKNDDFYNCFSSHRTFLNKYLIQVNSLRNRFIHGYSVNLEVNASHSEYVVSNHDTTNFPNVSGGGIIPELVLSNFVSHIVTNSKALTIDILNLFKMKLDHHKTKVPM